MPSPDVKHELIFSELVNTLGAGSVTDDLAVTESYSRDFYAGSYAAKIKPEFIVLPGNTEDVRKVVQIANRYGFPFSVIGSGLLFVLCGAVKPHWCIIDTKRMGGISIDLNNMYAVIGPHVTHAQLQAEAMRQGLYTGRRRSAPRRRAWPTMYFRECTVAPTVPGTRRAISWVSNGSCLMGRSCVRDH